MARWQSKPSTTATTATTEPRQPSVPCSAVFPPVRQNDSTLPPFLLERWGSPTPPLPQSLSSTHQSTRTCERRCLHLLPTLLCSLGTRTRDNHRSVHTLAHGA